MFDIKSIKKSDKTTIFIYVLAVFALVRTIVSLFTGHAIALNDGIGFESLKRDIAIGTLSAIPQGLEGISELRGNVLKANGVNGSYRLSDGIFGTNTDQCKWPLKSDYYSNTPGATEEPLDGQVLANPLLLVMPRFMGGASFSLLPGLQRLSYDADKAVFTLDYTVSPQSDDFAEPLAFMLITANAFDLGYRSLKIDSAKNENVDFFRASDPEGKIFKANNFYACVPDEDSAVTSFVWPAMFGVPTMKLDSLPATLHVDLFKSVVSEEDADLLKPDVSFIVKFNKDASAD